MHTQTFKQYCQDTGVTSICKTIRTNANAYPYVTVLRGNAAENIYLSKAASSEVAEGQAVKSIASSLFVVSTINADGESRTKLTFNSSYESMEDMFE